MCRTLSGPPATYVSATTTGGIKLLKIPCGSLALLLENGSF